MRRSYNCNVGGRYTKLDICAVRSPVLLHERHVKPFEHLNTAAHTIATTIASDDAVVATTAVTVVDVTVL